MTTPLRASLAATLATLALATAATPALAATAPQPTDWCDSYVAKYPIKGWDVQCIDPTKNGAAGWVSEEAKQVRIVRGMDRPTTQQAFGHEYAHVESAAFPATAKQWWAEQLGQPQWRTNTYLKSPNEVWAENRSRCKGWHDGSRGAGYTKVDCSLVQAMLDRVKADRDKAAAADREVNTGASEEVKSRLVVQIAWDDKTQRNWAWTWRWNDQTRAWETVSYAPA